MNEIAFIGANTTCGTIIGAGSSWRVSTGVGLRNVARQGAEQDTCTCRPGGPAPITSGSSVWTCDGLPIARESDSTGCPATIAEGAPEWRIPS